MDSKGGVQSKRRCESHESWVCIVGFFTAYSRWKVFRNLIHEAAKNMKKIRLFPGDSFNSQTKAQSFKYPRNQAVGKILKPILLYGTTGKDDV